MTNIAIDERLQQICQIFQLPGTYSGHTKVPSGNINDTYLVTCQDGTTKRSYMAQRVNIYVFKEPLKIMHNIDLVSRHISQKLGDFADDRHMLQFYSTASGQSYCLLDDEFWRVSKYIEDATAYDISENPAIIRAVGTAFGRFQRQLSDLDVSQLETTIPNFHNTELRLQTLFDHVAEDPCGRVAEAQAEIDYIAAMRERCCELDRLLKQGELPLRATHNDTKINNVMLDNATNEPLAVIDLDTVMPGLSVHDFGDAIRAAANTAREDEPDLSLVGLDLARYQAFTEGFISETADCLSQKELDCMALGALTITIELASRFLDDYLTGDLYFRPAYEGHNLVRARCQLQLAKDMAQKMPQMEAIVAKICHK